MELPESPETANGLGPFLVAEDLDGELLHLLELDALLATVEEVLVDPLRQLVRPAERHTDCDEGARH